jgi:hypothetical protein
MGAYKLQNTILLQIILSFKDTSYTTHKPKRLNVSTIFSLTTVINIKNWETIIQNALDG